MKLKNHPYAYYLTAQSFLQAMIPMLFTSTKTVGFMLAGYIPLTYFTERFGKIK